MHDVSNILSTRFWSTAYLCEFILFQTEGMHAFSWAFMDTYHQHPFKKNRKKEFSRYTIKDSQNAFLYIAETLNQLEEHINYQKFKKGSIQPFIYAIGSPLQPKNIGLFFDDIRYQFKTVLKAVDILFQIFYVFNLEFPLQCKIFYSFIELFFDLIKLVWKIYKALWISLPFSITRTNSTIIFHNFLLLDFEPRIKKFWNKDYPTIKVSAILRSNYTSLKSKFY